MFDNISTGTLLVLIGIAVIVLVYLIATNAMILTSLKAADASGLVDSVRGLPTANCVVFALSLAAVLVGGGVLLFQRRGDLIAMFHSAEARVKSYMPGSSSAPAIAQPPPAVSAPAAAPSASVGEGGIAGQQSQPSFG